MRATRALIHLQNLKRNIHAIRRRIGEGPLICVPIKADAYGHGATRVAIAAIQAGASWLAVASLQEGLELRQSGVVAPILLLSLPVPEELDELLAGGITPLVADAEFVDLLAERVAALPPEDRERAIEVHLKIDTGMGRVGCRPEEAPALARRIAATPGLRLGGCATHLAVADSAQDADVAYTKAQLARFSETLAEIRAAGVDTGIVHAANSGALVLHPEAAFDMVRPGLLVYGYDPVPERRDVLPVEPVMELRTRIVFLKTIRKGESVSYGRVWTAPRDTIVATLPIGYADGLWRGLSGRLSVRIGDADYPIVGRICMDQCLVDLGPDSAVRRWDEVTIFGPHSQSAAELARLMDTIPYEVTCAINKRVPRVYIE